MRAPPGGPLEVAVHAEPSAFGMGDGSSARPEWTDGLRRFHLYAFGSVAGEERALAPLRSLAPEAAQRLWRARALVHAVVRRWDQARRWSEGADFRQLSGWSWMGAGNTYAWAYSRRRGQASPALDLATLAEEALVPGPAPQVDDAAPACVQPSRWHWLSDQLRHDGLLDQPLLRDCPAFEAWADEPSLETLEILYVAASGRAVESLFGHVLLRLVRRDDPSRVRGPSFDTQVQLVALTGAERPGPEYAWRGLTGGYQLALITTTFGDLRRELLEGEQRGIRRFRLNLTASERRRALERIWELERVGYSRYFFFGHNCADALVDLVDAALEGGRRAPRAGPWPLSPAGALDALRTVRAGDRPLLEPMPGELQSTQLQALDAERRRASAALALLDGAGPQDRDALLRVDRALRSSDAAARARAYAALERWLDRTMPEGSEALREAAYRYLDDSVRIERYAVDASTARRRKVQLSALALGDLHLPTGAEEAAARQRLFQDEAALQGRWAVLDRAASLDDALEAAPKRPYFPEELEDLQRAAAAERAFLRATEAQARAVARHFARVDAWALRRRQETERVAREAAGLLGATTGSGLLRSSAGVAAGWPGGDPRLVLRSALLSEPLGERRLHGFRSTSEVELMSGELELSTGPPRIRASRLTALAFRTVLRDAQVEWRSPADALGWGFQLSADSLEDVSRARASAELIAALQPEPGGAFLALGLGPSLRVQMSPVLEPRAGLRASISERSQLGPVALVASATLDSAMGLDRLFEHLADINIAAEVTAGQAGAGKTIVLRPEVSWRWASDAAVVDLRAAFVAELR
ncbi:MAG TPA: DUF4105 domain-containing protein [Myxococcaceae bacterium]|jgi:hypothetical protein